jgi:hypothetical protein
LDQNAVVNFDNETMPMSMNDPTPSCREETGRHLMESGLVFGNKKDIDMTTLPFEE